MFCIAWLYEQSMARLRKDVEHALLLEGFEVGVLSYSEVWCGFGKWWSKIFSFWVLSGGEMVFDVSFTILFVYVMKVTS